MQNTQRDRVYASLVVGLAFAAASSMGFAVDNAQGVTAAQWALSAFIGLAVAALSMVMLRLCDTIGNCDIDGAD